MHSVVQPSRLTTPAAVVAAMVLLASPLGVESMAWGTLAGAGLIVLLQLAAVWAQCFTHGPWEAMRQLEASGCMGSGDAAVQAHVNALRPLLLAMMDRHEEAYAAGRESLASLPSTQPFADSVLSNAMAHIVSVMGEQHEAHRLLGLPAARDALRRVADGDLTEVPASEAVFTQNVAAIREHLVTTRGIPLSDADLRQRSVSPSGLSLLGLVRHLTEVEYGNASHGLVRWAPWRLVERTPWSHLVRSALPRPRMSDRPVSTTRQESR